MERYPPFQHMLGKLSLSSVCLCEVLWLKHFTLSSLCVIIHHLDLEYSDDVFPQNGLGECYSPNLQIDVFAFQFQG